MVEAIIPAIQVMEGGVQAWEVHQYIQTAMMAMITAVMMTAFWEMIEEGIE